MENTANSYQNLATELVGSLERERDREVLTRRYGLGQTSSETLDKIGKSFGITRERVRQIERSALKRLGTSALAKIKEVDRWLGTNLSRHGGLISLEKLSLELKASPAVLYFLAKAAPNFEVIDDNKSLKATIYNLREFTPAKITELAKELTDAFKAHGKPAKIAQIAGQIKSKTPASTLKSVGEAAKSLANYEELWGLKSWPQVNPKSIKDRAYLALKKHSNPLHFSDIAVHIERVTPHGRQVTTQAVHNELIKDPRFVLIGRGIYALGDWGYTAGTVADMIKEVLREAAEPLHKDEIIRRVLKRRQVKVTTIALNLQEKDHFERVAKATYKLRNQ